MKSFIKFIIFSSSLFLVNISYAIIYDYGFTCPTSWGLSKCAQRASLVLNLDDLRGKTFLWRGYEITLDQDYSNGFTVTHPDINGAWYLTGNLASGIHKHYTNRSTSEMIFSFILNNIKYYAKIDYTHGRAGMYPGYWWYESKTFCVAGSVGELSNSVNCESHHPWN